MLSWDEFEKPELEKKQPEQPKAAAAVEIKDEQSKKMLKKHMTPKNLIRTSQINFAKKKFSIH